jgi:hypothetical protein
MHSYKSDTHADEYYAQVEVTDTSLGWPPQFTHTIPALIIDGVRNRMNLYKVIIIFIIEFTNDIGCCRHS